MFSPSTAFCTVDPCVPAEAVRLLAAKFARPEAVLRRPDVRSRRATRSTQRRQFAAHGPMPTVAGTRDDRICRGAERDRVRTVLEVRIRSRIRPTALSTKAIGCNPTIARRAWPADATGLDSAGAIRSALCADRNCISLEIPQIPGWSTNCTCDGVAVPRRFVQQTSGFQRHPSLPMLLDSQADSHSACQPRSTTSIWSAA